MLENKEEIVLDSTNNVFVGPDQYFKLVIDKFDGQTVSAWHVEDAKGNKTQNLADRAKGKNIDLMLNVNCRTVSHFVNRISGSLLTEQQAKITQLSSQTAKSATEEKKSPDPAPTANTGVPIAVPIVIAVIAIAIIAYQAKRNKSS